MVCTQKKNSAKSIQEPMHEEVEEVLNNSELTRTALVVREVFYTLRDSCYSLLEEIITEMELDDVINAKLHQCKLNFQTVLR